MSAILSIFGLWLWIGVGEPVGGMLTLFGALLMYASIKEIYIITKVHVTNLDEINQPNIQVRCPNCKSLNPEKAEFCMSCGVFQK